MKQCIVYFSRTGSTKKLAQAISKAIRINAYDIKSKPNLKGCDTLILGTPVEAFSPAKETKQFVSRMPKGNGKAILFCTYELWRGFTFMMLKGALAKKGYKTILTVSEKGVSTGRNNDFSGSISKIKSALK